VLPVYKRSAWIPQCQRMIDQQIHQPDQVLVIEETESLRDNVRIKGAEYVELDNWTRPQDKFAMGGKLAQGEIVITWSTDDYFGPFYISSCMGHLEDNEVVSLQSAPVYNIVDRRWGIQHGIRGGHHAYRKSLLDDLPKLINGADDMREKWLPAIHDNIDISSVRVINDYMTIRHAPAGELRDGWRRSVTNSLEGGHMSKHEYTTNTDPDWAWLDSVMHNHDILQFYKDMAAHILDACPMRPA